MPLIVGNITFSSKIRNPSGKSGMMLLRLKDMNSKEYSVDMEMTSGIPDHFTMNEIKVDIDEVKRAIKRVSMKMTRKP